MQIYFSAFFLFHLSWSRICRLARQCSRPAYVTTQETYVLSLEHLRSRTCTLVCISPFLSFLSCRVCVCVYVHGHRCMYAHRYMFIHISSFACKCTHTNFDLKFSNACMHARMHARTHARTHAYKHTHTHTHTHTHSQARTNKCNC